MESVQFVHLSLASSWISAYSSSGLVSPSYCISVTSLLPRVLGAGQKAAVSFQLFKILTPHIIYFHSHTTSPIPDSLSSYRRLRAALFYSATAEKPVGGFIITVTAWQCELLMWGSADYAGPSQCDSVCSAVCLFFLSLRHLLHFRDLLWQW